MRNASNFDNKIKVVLASSSWLFLEGIGSILEQEPGIAVVSKVSVVQDVSRCVPDIKPDFIVLDNRSFGLDVYALSDFLANASSKTRVVLLSDGAKTDLPDIIHIDKRTTSEALIRIIKRGVSGGSERAVRAKKNDTIQQSKGLTETELKVKNLVEQGFGNRDIAKHLSISEKTVKAHLGNIFSKLGIKSRYQLIVYDKKVDF